MQGKQRNKKLRLLVRRLNQQRKVQAKQIDILCNDIIGVQRSFINTLNRFAFTADFCESMIGFDDLQSLLAEVATQIKQEFGDCCLAFFLIAGDSHQRHVFESNNVKDNESCQLEESINTELVDSIAKSNKVCTLDELLSMGLQMSPAESKELTAVTIPLSYQARTIGFMLIYRNGSSSLSDEQIKSLCAVRCGLSRAIKACAKAEQPIN
jgi:transcriptional regulator with GAF, ATPase, and Fis domain